VLPPLTGTALAVSGFGPALETRTDTYALLRFRVAAGRSGVALGPDPLGALRFGERPPTVAVLPADR
jgi:hypothetical protein